MEKSEKTRQYIVEVASPIFNKKGYAGTSISDVVAGTGLTKGAIYGNFINKDDLALASLEYNLDRVSKIIFSSVKREKHSCGKLAAFAQSFAKYLDATISFGGCPVVNAAVDSDDGNPLIKRKVEQFIKLWTASLVAIIENGKKNNEIRQDADADNFSMLFISLIEGSLMLSKMTGERKYVDAAVGHIISLVEGLRTC